MTTRFWQSAAKRWRKLYRHTRNSNMTFRQLRGLFIGQHGFEPPTGLPLTPAYELDWFRFVSDVPENRLYR